MMLQALHASLTLTAVLTGYQPAAGLFPWEIPLVPLIVITVIKYSTVNALPVILSDAPWMPAAPCPHVWGHLLLEQQLVPMP